jgi:ZIP family zinc transporter
MVRSEPLRGIAAWSQARRTALLIAVGIGLHNFAEGLAIGGSAARGEIGLAAVLVIGFALHNATEGFGIVTPLAADGDRPGWAFLLASASSAAVRRLSAPSWGNTSQAIR